MTRCTATVEVVDAVVPETESLASTLRVYVPLRPKLVLSSETDAVSFALVTPARVAAVLPVSNTRYVPEAPARFAGAFHPITTERLPFESSWLMAGWRLYRRIRRAALDKAAFHLLIDAAAMEADGRRALRSLAKLARRVAALRDRGLLCVETLGTAAARLSDVPAVTPQQSILRRAA